eukprot:Polyplicarium_translucidae@DN3379_c2_g1_i4.p1
MLLTEDKYFSTGGSLHLGHGIMPLSRFWDMAYLWYHTAQPIFGHVVSPHVLCAVLPRLPVNIKTQYGSQLIAIDDHRRRKRDNKQQLHLFSEGTPVMACSNGDWLDGEVIAVDDSCPGRINCFIRLEDGSEEAIDMGLVILKPKPTPPERLPRQDMASPDPPKKQRPDEHRHRSEHPTSSYHQRHHRRSRSDPSQAAPPQRASAPAPQPDVPMEDREEGELKDQDDMRGHGGDSHEARRHRRRHRRRRSRSRSRSPAPHRDRSKERSKRHRDGEGRDEERRHRSDDRHRRRRTTTREKGESKKTRARSRSRSRRREEDDKDTWMPPEDLRREDSGVGESLGGSHTPPDDGVLPMSKSPGELMEEYRRRERAKALAPGKDYARRPSSYKSSLSVRVESSLRKREKSPETVTVETRTPPCAPTSRTDSAAEQKKPSLLHKQKMAQLVQRYSKGTASSHGPNEGDDQDSMRLG